MLFGRQFLLAFSAVQLHMRMLNVIICHRRAELKNKEIILHLIKKTSLRKKQKFIGANKVVLPHSFCVLKFLTLSNNNWTASSVQVKYILGDPFNFNFLFGSSFYQMCLTDLFLFVFIKFSTKINNEFSTHRQYN